MHKLVKYTARILTSNRDYYGNCYHAAVIVNHETGKMMECTIDGPSNLTTALYVMTRDTAYDYHSHQEYMGIRDFNRITKKWSYVGCSPEQIIPAIKAQID